MANIIKIKHNETAGDTPTTSDLAVVGEIAINSTDKKIFTRNSSGTIVELGGSGEANEFSFKTIEVSGQTSVVADTTTDTLTLVAGTGMTITTSADQVTLASSGGGGGITTGKAIAMAMIFG
jgi:hypothetical protein